MGGLVPTMLKTHGHEEARELLRKANEFISHSQGVVESTRPRKTPTVMAISSLFPALYLGQK